MLEEILDALQRIKKHGIFWIVFCWVQLCKQSINICYFRDPAREKDSIINCFGVYTLCENQTEKQIISNKMWHFETLI